MNPEFVFWQYRVSTLFLLICIPFFLPMRYSKIVTALLLGLCYLATGLLDGWCFLLQGCEKVPLWLTLAEIPMVQCMPLFISSHRDFRAVFVGLTASAYVMAGNICGGALFLRGFSMPVCVLVQCALHAFLLGLMVCFSGRGIKRGLEENRLNWWGLCMIPALFYVTEYMLVVWPCDYEVYRPLIYPALAVLVLMVCGYILLIRMFHRSSEEEELRRNAQLLDTYAVSLKRETEKVQRQSRETAILHHDLKHYLILVNGCLESGDTEEMKRLAEQLDQKIRHVTPTEVCGHPVLNHIFSYYQQQAQEQKIRFSCDVKIPPDPGVDVFEFAAVLSNLLDNAVRAAAQPKDAENRFVKVRVDFSEERMFLEMVNGCDKAPKVSEKTGLPVSERGKGHGYGMQSIMAFVKKHHAVFDCQAGAGSFCIRMLLQKESE